MLVLGALIVRDAYALGDMSFVQRDEVLGLTPSRIVILTPRLRGGFHFRAFIGFERIVSAEVRPALVGSWLEVVTTDGMRGRYHDAWGWDVAMRRFADDLNSALNLRSVQPELDPPAAPPEDDKNRFPNYLRDR
jgi:hypothetical protein